jgi:hypothetical protein
MQSSKREFRDLGPFHRVPVPFAAVRDACPNDLSESLFVVHLEYVFPIVAQPHQNANVLSDWVLYKGRITSILGVK